MALKPRSEFKVLLVYPNLYMMLVPSLAIGIFTKLLKEEGYVLELFETTNYLDDHSASPANRVKFGQAREFDFEKDLGANVKTDNVFEDFRRKVLSYKPDLILVSAVEDVILQTVGLLESISDLEIPHLLGGVFPTSAGDRCFDFSAINNIARGEGEAIIIEYAERIRCGKPVDDVLGTWCRNEKGKIIKNANPPLVNINGLSPDFELFEDSRFYRPMGGNVFKTVPIETYRGCPYACTFCNSPMQRDFSKEVGQGNFMRRKNMIELNRELRRVVEEIKPEFIYFIDDSFLARPKEEIFEFCDMYEDFKLPFWFNTRPENCLPDVMKRLCEVGCYRVSFGIECGNEGYRRKILRRNVSNDQLVEAFNLLADTSVTFSLNLIIGFPGETRDLVMETVELVRRLRGYDTLTFSIFTPYHGTQLREVAVRNGWLAADTITKHTTSSSLLRMPKPYLSATEIDNLMRVLPLYCYFPKSEWGNIRRAESPDEEGNRILDSLQKIYKRDFLGETQFTKKVPAGSTGCKSNSRDAIYIESQLLTDEQLAQLTPLS
jgi:radical SAM superfamily enzyme YgiQ (UPF0313 family)